MTSSTATLRVRPLTTADREVVLPFVERDPVRDVFIASRIRHDRALTAGGWGPLWGAFDGDRLTGVLHVGPNMVPAVDTPDALDALASVATGPGPARMVVGERFTVERLWSRISASYAEPREIRARQFVYVLTADQLAPVAGGAVAELAAPGDEGDVVEVSAAMHLEEMGEDPMVLDPAGYRRRVRSLIERRWTFLYRVSGRIAFKMDIGCAGDRTGQIQGVYTPPGLRRRGVATAGMAACCALALERFPVLSLYVNDFNTPAVALYERLGFTRAPYDFQTVLLA
jgi:ribosomal protein S18 acetylase RimI-like enzyme